jgi:DNA-binding beta-propeller fold protein YncE
MWGAFGNKPVDADECENVSKPDFKDPQGSSNFSIVHSLRVANDGTVYVADRENRRVQMFTNDGKFVKQMVKSATLFARNVALSPDPEQQFLYVGDGKEIAILDPKTLELVGSVQGPDVIGGGHLMTTDQKGNIYVAATAQGMQRLTFKGMSPAGK